MRIQTIERHLDIVQSQAELNVILYRDSGIDGKTSEETRL